MDHKLEGLKSRWIDTVRTRIGSHPFGEPEDGRPSGINMLADALFRMHFQNERFGCVRPPLPGMPKLPLDARWVELQLDDAYTSVAIDPERRVLESLEGPHRGISVKLMLANKESVLVLGRPGSGKSTLLMWAARQMLTETRGQFMIPLLVPLRSYARWRARGGVGIYKFFWEEQLRLSPEWTQSFVDFMQDVESGYPSSLRDLCRVMLDGWDEVPFRLRPSLEEELERFRWLLPSLITSRPVGTGTGFLPEKRLEIVPLPFASMKALMTMWFRASGLDDRRRIRSVNELCTHLDQNVGLRELARSPYVLTLLCAVVANKRKPRTRSELYSEAVTLMAQYCRETFGNEGYTFPQKTMIESERVAYELLGRDATSSFEFTEDEVSDQTEDDQLLETWHKSRLVGITNDYGPTFAFLHATLHEYLAGKELLRRVADGDAAIRRVGVDARWLQPLVLAAGAIPPSHPLWHAVANLFDMGDRFGLLAVRIAPLLAESGVRDGGISLVGRDVRQELWNGILQSPDPRPYIDALIELDTDFAVDTAKQISRLDPDDFDRVMVLYTRMDPNHQRRPELVHYLAENLVRGKSVVTSSNYDLTEIMSFRPDEPLSLTGAGDYRTATEMLHSLSETEDPGRQRSILMHLARSGTSAAEQELIARFKKTDDLEQLDDLFDALRALGTFGVRDAFLSWLKTNPDHEPHVVKGLEILRQFPIPGRAEVLLNLLHPDNSRTIRVHAALALGGAQDDGVINRLADHARTDQEFDIEVRKATFEALARAGAVGMVQQLYREPENTRTERSEQLVICGYLAAVARSISPAMDQSGSLPRIESLVLKILGREDVAPLEIHHSAALKYSTAIPDALKGMLHHSLGPEVRAAVCQTLRELRDTSAVEQIEVVLKDAIAVGSPEEEKVVEEAALTLAFLDAERLKGIEHPCIHSALWRYCLATDKLMLVNSAPAADKVTDLESDGMLVPDPPKPLAAESSHQLQDVLQQLLNHFPQPMAGNKSEGGRAEKRQREEMIERLLSKDPLMESPEVAGLVRCDSSTVRRSYAWTKRKELRKRVGRGGRISEEAAAFSLSQSTSEETTDFGSMINEYLGDGNLSLDVFLQQLWADEITPNEGRKYLESLQENIYQRLSKMPANDRQYDTFIQVADRVNSLLRSPEITGD